MICNYCGENVEECFYSKITYEHICYDCINDEGVKILLRDKQNFRMYELQEEVK